MKGGVIVIVCIIAAAFPPVWTASSRELADKIPQNAKHPLGDKDHDIDHIADVDDNPKEKDQEAIKEDSKRTTGFMILYPFRSMLSGLGELSTFLSTVVHVLVTVLDNCFRIPARIIKVLVDTFIDGAVYLILDVFLNVFVYHTLKSIIWIPHEFFGFLLNAMPLEEVISKCIFVLQYILHKVVLNVTVPCYWLGLFTFITSFSCYILHKAKIITVTEPPTSRQAIKNNFRAMTSQNTKLWIRNTTAGQYMFILLLTLFLSFHSFYTFIPVSNYILRHFILRLVSVLYWIMVVITTSYLLCKMVLSIYMQKYIVLNPVSSNLNHLWKFVCTNRTLTLSLQWLFDLSVWDIVKNTKRTCSKYLESANTRLSLINNHLCLNVRWVFKYTFQKTKCFIVPWSGTITDKIRSLGAANIQHTTKENDDSAPFLYDDQRNENELSETKEKKEIMETTKLNSELIQARKRHQTLNSSIPNRTGSFDDSQWSNKYKTKNLSKSGLENAKTNKESKSCDNDIDDGIVEQSHETDDPVQTNDAEELRFGNIPIMMSSIDIDLDKDIDGDIDEKNQEKEDTVQTDDVEDLRLGNIPITMSSLDIGLDKDTTKQTKREFGGNLYIYDEVEDKRLWEVQENTLE